MSSKVDVVVRKDGAAIDRRDAMPVRKRPDGTAGVVHSGWVYPLRPDHSIDVTDEPLSKAECPSYFEGVEALVYSTHNPEGIAYFLERARWKSYLVFDGDEAQARLIESAFAEAGLSGGYGESYRPAKDGNLYDWFVRLPPDVEDEFVAEIMARTASAKTNDDEDVQEEVLLALLRELGLDIPGLIERTNTLTAERDDAVAAREVLREELTALRAREQKTKARSAARVATLERRVAALEEEKLLLRETTPSGALEATDSRIEYIEAEHRRLREDLRLAEELTALYEQDLRHAKDRIRNMEREEAKPAVPVGVSKTNGTRREAKRLLDVVCKELLPHIELDHGDLKNLLCDFSDLADCFRYLRRLATESGKLPEAKKFHSFDGLWEIPRVRTGRPECASDGRIYYRQRDDRFDVGVHVKKDDAEQQRFVRERFGKR